MEVDMVWHIFRKDVRLLWPWIAFTAFAQALNAALWLFLGPASEPAGLQRLAYLAAFSALLSIVLTIVRVIQQDPIPGVRQDWLVRPIPRRDLLLAKLLFLLLAIHIPLLLVDISEQLLFGFPLLTAGRSALLRGAAIFCLLGLPTMILATFTRSIGGLLTAALALLLSIVLLSLLVGPVGMNLTTPISISNGIAWVNTAVTALILVAAAAVILPMRYQHRSSRSTRTVYGLLAAACAAILLAPFLLWKPAFALQQYLSPQPEASRGITLSFDPHPPAERGEGHMMVVDTTVIVLPVRVSGLTREGMLVVDEATVRLLTAGGSRLYSGHFGHFANIRLRNHELRDGIAHSRTSVNIPDSVYTRLQDRAVRLEIDFSLTLLRRDSTQIVEVMDQPQQIAGFGWCATPARTPAGAELRCVSSNRLPSCVIATLHETAGKLHPAQSNRCSPDYAPLDANVFPDAMHRLSDSLMLFHPLFDVPEPHAIDPRSMPWRTELSTFAPQAHFTQKVTVQNFRLSEWTVGAARLPLRF
jgi:hypothetical protein